MRNKPLFQRNFNNTKSFEKALDQFRGRYELRSQPKYTVQRHFYDTFDWRLYRRGYVFEQDDTETGKCRIRSLGRQGEQLTAAVKQVPDFSWNIDHRGLKTLLTPLLSVRRLIQQDEIQVSVEPYELMDRRGKILIRFELEKYLRPDKINRLRSALVNCRFYPLKGYEKTCEKQLRALDKIVKGSGKTDDPIDFILSLHNRQPHDYTGKLNLTFNPDMSIGQAMATTLLFHMDMIKINLPGIKADIDTEFLHDLRVANRRSRSLVTQIKRVLPPDKDEYFREIFAWLSNETSDHRDMDVFILDMPHYQSMLPEEMRGDLEPLRELLKNSRQKIHKRLLKSLTSEKFNKFLSECETYFRTGLKDHFRTEKGKRPVVKVASKAIWKAYKRLLKKGYIASGTGDGEALHDLRKSGKKLRYLLETFKSLYPAGDMEKVILHCRNLQSLLGRIVDYRVQQRYLLGLSDMSVNSSELPAATNSCIQYLVKTYKKLEQEAVGKFDDEFAGFSSPDTKKLFRKLFRQAG